MYNTIMVLDDSKLLYESCTWSLAPLRGCRWRQAQGRKFFLNP